MSVPKPYREYKQVPLTHSQAAVILNQSLTKTEIKTEELKGGNNYIHKEKCRLRSKEIRVQINP